MDWEANIRGCNLHGEDVYYLTQLVRLFAWFADSISVSHRTKG
uniref:Uncharacterized protein n=1 Tax=Arundo donax TaxID=35708 RepID=A0A0A9FFF3_ARUDO